MKFLLLALLSSSVFAQLNMDITHESSTAINSDNARWYQVDYNRDVISKEDIRAKVLNTLPYVSSPISSSNTLTHEYVAALTQGTTYLKAQVQRRNEIAEQIKGMDQIEKRTEILGLATDSLRASRDYYLEDKFEDGRIAGQIADVLLDLATSLTPGISWVRDVYEAVSGKDLHTGEYLDNFSHSAAVLGAVTVGYGGKALKAVGVFEKLTKTAASNFGELRTLFYAKSLSEIKDTIGFFKKHKIYPPTDMNAVSVTNAFMKGAKREVLNDDLKVYRYYLDGFSHPRGSWVTPVLLPNPKQALALPQQPTAVKEWIIPKGTEIMKGSAAENYGEVGGAVQILVNKNSLRDL